MSPDMPFQKQVKETLQMSAKYDVLFFLLDW